MPRAAARLRIGTVRLSANRVWGARGRGCRVVRAFTRIRRRPRGRADLQRAGLEGCLHGIAEHDGTTQGEPVGRRELGCGGAATVAFDFECDARTDEPAEADG